eukprot:PhF_6_TR17030/c0_g4_i1/m.25867
MDLLKKYTNSQMFNALPRMVKVMQNSHSSGFHELSCFLLLACTNEHSKSLNPLSNFIAKRSALCWKRPSALSWWHPCITRKGSTNLHINLFSKQCNKCVESTHLQ